MPASRCEGEGCRPLPGAQTISTATGEKARCCVDRDAEMALFLAVKSEAGSSGEHFSLF